MFVFSKGPPSTYNPIMDKPCAKAGTYLSSKSGRATNGTQREINPFVINDFQARFNVWRYATGKGLSTTDDLAFEHPAVAPEALARDHIHSWSNPGDLVYDCFMGSGTTAKAAHQLGRRWIGSEISQEYVDLAERRLEPLLAQADLFEVTNDVA
jgi:site-specific DNA-methyltransferase (adenine-specific)